MKEITVNDNTIGQKPNMAVTLGALDMLRQYAIDFPHLPAPYITISTHSILSVRLLVEVGAFDQWREALNIPTNLVEINPINSYSSHISAGSTMCIQVNDQLVDVHVYLFAADLPSYEGTAASETVSS